MAPLTGERGRGTLVDVLELVGRRWPSIALPGTDGRQWSLDCLDVPAVVYAYPRTGRPGEPPLTHEWDSIPGAVGCTAESCEVAGVTLIRRTTLFVTAGRIAHVWYPVPDPEQHPGQVYAWLLDHVPD